MVPCDDDFVAVWECVEPIELGLEFGESAVDGQVACVDENVAVGNAGLRVVRVGYADEFDGWRRWDWR